MDFADRRVAEKPTVMEFYMEKDKLWSKTELFHKTMSLKKLQEICTERAIGFDVQESKGTLAHKILNAQRDEELTSGDKGMDNPHYGHDLPGESDGGTQGATSDVDAAVAAQNKEAAKGELDAGGAIGKDARAGKTDDLADRKLPYSKLDVLTDEMMEAIKQRLGSKAIEERVRVIEAYIEEQKASKRKAETLHGHIDDLPKIGDLPPPGTIDDLPKI